MRVALLAVLLLAQAGAALAAPAGVALESAAEVELAGAVEAHVGGGTLLVAHDALEGDLTLRNATGEVVVLTWKRFIVSREGSGVQRSLGPPERTRYEVEDATLRIVGARERVVGTIAGGEETLMRVHGQGAGRGRPGVMPYEMGPVAGVSLDEGTTTNNATFRQGWPFVGDYATGAEPLGGFPAWPAPRVDVRGPVHLQLIGGNLTFVDARNRTVVERLGEWREDGVPVVPAPGEPRVVVYRRLLFLGETGGTDIPAGDEWLAAGPRMGWAVEGRVRWTNATGEVDGPGGVRRFRDATVEGVGAFAVEPESTLVRPAGVEPLRFEAEGDWTTLTVGAQTVVAQGRNQNDIVAPAAGIALLALAASLLTEWGRGVLGRAAGVFYTRFRRDEILEHETRRRIVEAARASPGVHLRELHRRVGGAWGVFSFHVGMLVQARYIQTRREGRYVVAYPPGAPVVKEVAPHHPVARRIHDALPEDGSAVAFGELRDGLDISRQLLAHHLKKLESLGLVTVTIAPDRRRFVARRVPAERPPRGAGAS